MGFSLFKSPPVNVADIDYIDGIAGNDSDNSSKEVRGIVTKTALKSLMYFMFVLIFVVVVPIAVGLFKGFTGANSSIIDPQALISGAHGLFEHFTG